MHQHGGVCRQIDLPPPLPLVLSQNESGEGQESSNRFTLRQKCLSIAIGHLLQRRLDIGC